ncbi:MAG TPA: hypothetical protein VNM22_11135 [Candidatus Limnocylindrales bacterium]|nr:hypothetical protein [Candidatus Limnocylindrales bacterium]
MNFLYKLFPFHSLLTLDDNTLTAWWVLGTILYFVISAVWLFLRCYRIITTLRQTEKSFSIDSIQKKDLLKENWMQYAQTFLSENRPKTSEDAEIYFNEQSILSHRLILRYWLAVPGILVGVGILGTFVGLTVGIANFDIGSTEKIERSIQTLLSGMGTAFVSSVWGMLLSLMFGVLEKFWFNQVGKRISSLCTLLDQKFRLKKVDELRYAQEDEARLLRNLLGELFVFHNEENTEILPAHVFRDLHREAEEQTKALKSFSTDLADKISLATETIINASRDQIQETVQRTFNIQLFPLLNKIDDSLKELTAQIQKLQSLEEESSNTFIEQAVSDLKNFLGEIGQQFSAPLFNSAKLQIESLEDNFKTLTEDLKKNIVDMEAGLSTIPNSFQQISKELMDNFSNSLEIQMQTLGNIVKAASENLSELPASFQQTSQRISESLEAFSQTVQKLNSTSQDILEKGLKLTESMTTANSEVQGALEQLQPLSIRLVAVVKNLELSSNNLQTSTTQFIQQTKEFLNTNQSTLLRLQESLKQAQEVAVDYASKFKKIQDGLRDIFSEVQQGLSRYQETTREGLNNALGQFTNLFSQAVHSISGSIEELSESIEVLNDLANKLRSQSS